MRIAVVVVLVIAALAFVFRDRFQMDRLEQAMGTVSLQGGEGVPEGGHAPEQSAPVAASGAAAESAPVAASAPMEASAPAKP